MIQSHLAVLPAKIKNLTPKSKPHLTKATR